MNFDDYLTEYYGFNTTDGKWKRMSNQGKNLLRDSYKIDMSKADGLQVAALPQTQGQ